MKYSVGPCDMKKDYMDWMQERRQLFRDVTGTSKTLRLTLVSSGGIKPNKYSASLQGKVELDDLFITLDR